MTEINKSNTNGSHLNFSNNIIPNPIIFTNNIFIKQLNENDGIYTVTREKPIYFNEKTDLDKLFRNLLDKKIEENLEKRRHPKNI